MRLGSPQVLAGCLLALMAIPGWSQDPKLTKTFISPTTGERLEACAIAKKQAQSWVESEIAKAPVTAAEGGRLWTAALEGYSQCDCENSTQGTLKRWRCSVDATIRARDEVKSG